VARRMAEQVAELQAVVFLVFTGLMLASAVSVSARALDLRRSGRRIPLLLFRDVIVFGLLAVPFSAILFVRAMGLGPQLTGDLTWTLVTSTPAITALIVFLLFEGFVVGRRR
jgi:hypothetical protein